MWNLQWNWSFIEFAKTDQRTCHCLAQSSNRHWNKSKWSKSILCRQADYALICRSSSMICLRRGCLLRFQTKPSLAASGNLNLLQPKFAAYMVTIKNKFRKTYIVWASFDFDFKILYFFSKLPLKLSFTVQWLTSHCWRSVLNFKLSFSEVEPVWWPSSSEMHEEKFLRLLHQAKMCGEKIFQL